MACRINMSCDAIDFKKKERKVEIENCGLNWSQICLFVETFAFLALISICNDFDSFKRYSRE